MALYGDVVNSFKSTIITSMSRSKVIVITGASDGIGAAAARILHAKGHTVILVGRSKEKTTAIAQELNAPYYLADFADLDQVRTLAQKLTHDFPRIDVLANNAGGIMGKRELTKDGFEKTFQVNHLAAFLLTYQLMPTLLASNASIIQTASVAAERFSKFHIDDLQNERAYSPDRAYGDAKFANILFTRELHRRYHDRGIHAASFHPGIVGTSFASDTTHFLRYIYHAPIISKLFTISPTKGAETLVWLAQEDKWESGDYYIKCRSKKIPEKANNTELSMALWDKSLALLQLDNHS